MSAKKTIVNVLSQIQYELHAPKNLENKFGGFNYRSAEKILEAVKPHLEEAGAAIILSDEMVQVGDRIYLKATATIHWNGESISNSAYAREPLIKKGMDDAQVTGATSSYARKYALNGLLAIDDSKDDPDTKEQPVADQIESCTTYDQLAELWRTIPKKEQNAVLDVFKEKSAELKVAA